MGFERYFLHDLFTAAEFNKLEEREHERQRQQHEQQASTKQRVSELEQGIGRVALLARSLAELCLEKGLITKEELRVRLLADDMADGAGDGKLDPKVVLPGESKLADLEPMRPVVPPSRRRRK